MLYIALLRIFAANQLHNTMKFKFHILWVLLCCSLTVLKATAKGNDNRFNKVSFLSLSKLEVSRDQGLSGAFSGNIDGQAVIAGGCNFPNTPASNKGKKVFYNHIYSLLDNQWTRIGTLPTNLAYGVSITTQEGIVCIGGNDGKNSSDRVFLLKKKAKDKLSVTTTPLPSLPIPLDNFSGAAAPDGTIYVAGGQSNGVASQLAFSLKAGEKEWKELPSMPDNSRIQSTAVIQNGANGPLFLVIGGYSDITKKVASEGLIYDIKKSTWHKTSPIVSDGKPLAVVGAASVASGSMFVVCFGGVNKDIFESALQGQYGDDYLKHSPEWYRFNPSLLIYNTITDAWVTETSSPFLARAGMSVIPMNNQWMVVSGESKPGIRATNVTMVKMETHSEFGWLNWTVLIAYLLMMIALGYYFMKRENGAEDFFKGGGRIPWWAAGISIYATMLSAITYMAYPAKAFATNWTYYPMLVTILIVSLPVIRYYLPFFRRLNVTSAYEYLEHRFNAPLRLMASALFIIFMVARMALVLYLPSLALTAVTGIDIYICIVLMALITIVYCTMGGVEAVVWGDVVQGIILVGGALLAIAYLVFSTEGGASGFLSIASENGKFQLFDWSLDYKSATFWVVIIGGMANNLISYTSDQTVIQRYLTTKDEKAAKNSILLNGVMSVFVSIAFFAIGAGLFTFFKTHPAEMDYTMTKNDIIFPFFMMSQLPAGIAGLLIAAIFAATMSTISSNINSVATAFTVDFYQRFKKNASNRHILLTARYSSLISGVFGMLIALLMATWEILSLLDFFQEILGLLSSGLGGLFLMGIFFPRIGAKSATMGFLAGIVSVFLTKNLTETSFLLYGAIGMTISVLVAWIISLILHEERSSPMLTWAGMSRQL